MSSKNVAAVSAWIKRAVPALTIVLAVSATSMDTQAQTFTSLYSFTGQADGGIPVGPLALDANGNIYGTAAYSQNGVGPGTAWKLTNAGKLIVLHSFGATGDGVDPNGGVIRDADGNLYGTTYLGGNGNTGPGTIFKISGTGKETVLYRFKGTADGAQPSGGLFRDGTGNLYGSTGDGGKGGWGTVFNLNNAGKLIVLHSFSGPPDGEEAGHGTLVQDAEGNFYGVTYWGGQCSYTGRGCGTVFRLTPNKGKWKEAVLYRFNLAKGNGGFPNGALLLAKSVSSMAPPNGVAGLGVSA